MTYAVKVTTATTDVVVRPGATRAMTTAAPQILAVKIATGTTDVVIGPGKRNSVVAIAPSPLALYPVRGLPGAPGVLDETQMEQVTDTATDRVNVELEPPVNLVVLFENSLV